MIKILSKFFPSKHEKDIKIIMPLVDEINRYYSEYNSLSDDELRAKTQELKDRIKTEVKELEERIYNKFQPRYSIKGKRGAKTYTLTEKHAENKNAYNPWTKEDDDKLELLFCEGKTATELSEIFARNKGAINSRIKKLELKEKYCG